MDKIGIDVSANNGPINWDLVKLDPQSVKFAYIKTDANRFCNAYGAAYAGIQFGYYHTTSLNDALSEAKLFRNAIKEMPPPSLPCVLQIKSDEITMPSDQVQFWISAFVMDMIQNGYPKMMLAATTQFLNTHLPGTHPFGHLPLMLQHYQKGFVIPRGWDKIKIWQFTTKARILGVEGDVNMGRAEDL